MRYKSYIILLIFMQVGNFVSYSQINTKFDQALQYTPPPTPEVAAFRDISNYNVSEYSGIANTSIPLYTVKYRDIEIPINLTYGSNGIKVAQEASWVGLGWNLSVGGSIDEVFSTQRNLRGFPGIKISQSTFDKIQAGGVTDSYVSNPFPSIFPAEFPNTGFSHRLNENYESKTIVEGDAGSPPILSFNFLGFSGSFFAHPVDNRFVVMNAHQELKIEQIDYGFKITDTNSNQYFFKALTSSGFSSGNGHVNRSYLLQKIILRNKEEIIFKYSDPYQSNTLSYNDVVTAHLENMNGQEYYSTNSFRNGPYMHSSSPEYRVVYHYNSYLTEIITPRETIKFSLGEREDLKSVGNYIQGVNVSKFNDAKRVDNISILDSKGITFKRFEFTYDYFVSNLITNESVCNLQDGINSNYTADYDVVRLTDSWNNKRLKLLSLKEVAVSYVSGSKVENEMPKYTFSYYEDKQFPNKISKSIDYWGYYNAQSNTRLLPKPILLPRDISSKLPNDIINKCTANRGVNTYYCDALMLKKITFPTGGSQEFYYSPNDFCNTKVFSTVDFDNNNSNPTNNKGAGCRIDKIIFSNESGPVKQRKFFYTDNSSVSTGRLLSKLRFWATEGRDYLALIDTYEAPYDNVTKLYYEHALYSFLTIGANSSAPYSLIFANTVGYDRVDVQDQDIISKVAQTLSSGTTKKYFYNEELAVRFNTNDLRIPVFTSFLNGKIKREEYCKGNGVTPFKTIDYEYSEVINKEFFGIIGYQVIDNPEVLWRTCLFCSKNCICDIETDRCGYIYNFYRYLIPCKLYNLKSATETEVFGAYLSNPGVTASKTTSYSYNSLSPFLTKSKIDEQSDGSKIFTNYTYSSDVASAYNETTLATLNLMRDKNIVDKPLAIDYKLNDTLLLSKNIINYTFSNDILVAASSYEKNNVAVDPFNYSIYDKYDSKGNVTQYHKFGDVPNVILWGYNQTLPIASIENSTLDEVITAFGGVLPDFKDGGLTAAQVTTLRAIAKYRVTTYTHNILFGITSQTDPNGVSKFYEYDAFGRLICIKDDAGNIVKAYTYNYKR